jgi:cytochrome c peroxidase
LIALFLIFFFNSLKADEVLLPIGLQNSTRKTININLEQANVGKKLFFDKNLSSNKKISCSSCHNPDTGYTINSQFAKGVNGKISAVNPPAIINRFNDSIQFWDGRAPNLHSQAYGPLFSPDEMNNDREALLGYLNSTYKISSIEVMINSLVEFQKTILIGNSRYDKYKAGDVHAITSDEKKGMDLFFNKFKCQNCHSGENFTNDKIEVRCYPKDFIKLTDEEINNLRRFKVPTLRNLSKSWPYLHDGNLSKIEDVVDFYNNTGIFNPNENKVTEIISISRKENKLLVKFLKTLNELNYRKSSK